VRKRICIENVDRGKFSKRDDDIVRGCFAAELIGTGFDVFRVAAELKPLPKKSRCSRR